VSEPLLEASGIVKSFGGVRALRGVDFAAHPGEVAALVGDNGAGKSTLVKILSGTLAPDGGEIRFEGRQVAIPNPVAARELGINTTVAAANLPDVCWAVPVLILAAVANGVLEEVVIVGYLLTRLRDLGWRTWHAVAASALLRGSYHLYQGFGAFVGNAVMGAVFALFFLRTRRVVPLIIAHTVLDVVAYLGYTLLRDRVSFL